MPWKECQIVDERLRFIARLLDGETGSACSTPPYGVKHPGKGAG